MLTRNFQLVYDTFKMNFYQSLCQNSKELNMQEAFSLDVIHMLGNPTILEFANYMEISQPNATYKINQMIQKGYLVKELCSDDKRSYRLKVTEKFLEVYRGNDRFIEKTLKDIESMFKPEEVQVLQKMLNEISIYMSQGEKND